LKGYACKEFEERLNGLFHTHKPELRLISLYLIGLRYYYLTSAALSQKLSLLAFQIELHPQHNAQEYEDLVQDEIHAETPFF